MEKTQFKILDKVLTRDSDNVMTIISVSGDYAVCIDGEAAREILVDRLQLFSAHDPRPKHDFLKMYVVVDRECPVGLGINGMVHVAYAAGNIFAGETINNECIEEYNSDSIEWREVSEWHEKSYRNVSVVGDTFDILEAMRVCDEMKIPYVTFSEPDWLEANGRPLAVAFYPQYVWPEVFSKFELHSGTIKRFANTRT